MSHAWLFCFQILILILIIYWFRFKMIFLCNEYWLLTDLNWIDIDHDWFINLNTK